MQRTTTTTSPRNTTMLFNFDGGDEVGEAEEDGSGRRRRRKQQGSVAMGNDDAWIGDALPVEAEGTAGEGGSLFDMRPGDEEHGGDVVWTRLISTSTLPEHSTEKPMDPKPESTQNHQ